MDAVATNQSAELIRKIYGTVTNSSDWEAVLADIADTFSSSASFVCAKQTASGVPSGLLSHGVNRLYFERYRDHHHRHDILFDALVHKPANRFFSNQSLCEDQTYLASSIYNELCAPLDFRYTIIGTLADSFGDVSINVGLLRDHDGQEFSEPEALSASTLMPHISRSLELAYQLKNNGKNGHDTYGVLDHLEQGVVICSAGGRTRYENRAFNQISLESHLFRSDGSRQLIFRNHGNHRIFKQLVEDVMSPVIGSFHSPHSDTACVTDGEQRYLIRIRPWIEDNASLWGTQSEPGYLLFIREAGSKRVPPARSIAALHPLTRSESEISHYLCRGMAADEIARTRGVSASTVRQQIKAMMRKLNCHKQGELVAYLLTNTLM